MSETTDNLVVLETPLAAWMREFNTELGLRFLPVASHDDALRAYRKGYTPAGAAGEIMHMWKDTVEATRSLDEGKEASIPYTPWAP